MSIDTMRIYCSYYPLFQDEALDMMIDMLNDETVQVRLKALTILKSLIEQSGITLSEEHIAMTMLATQDPDSVIRMTGYKLMSHLIYPSTAIFEKVRARYMEMLLVHPTDKLSIFEALSVLGAKNPTFVHRLIEQILGWDRRFTAPPQDPNDIRRKFIM
jgi:integrator complex subunit 4